jgi:acetylglutamate kinase
MKPRLVIKLGGSSLQNPETILQLARLVQGYQMQGHQVIVVHGGGPAINEELNKRGISWQFINGQRQTTSEMMQVIDEVLSRKVNSSIVSQLQSAEVFARGLSAADAKILFCTQANEELMQVGKVEAVNPEAIEEVLQVSQQTPVIVPIGFGEKGVKYNVNADWAAAKIAISLKAKKLIFLTDQLGILDEKKQLVQKIDPKGIDQMIKDGIILGGMYTKVQAMMAALVSGVEQVRVLHASLALEVLTNKNVGTLLMAQDFNLSQQGDIHE